MPYLLITTSRSLLLVETVSGTCYCLDNSRDHYYGITRDFGQYYVGVRNRANNSLVQKEQERGTILRFSASATFIGEIEPPFPMRDIHQILVYGGRLWVTCTHDNLIAFFDGFSWDTWHPLGVSSDVPYDKNHFNSVIAFGNTLCVVAHNLGASTGRLSELLFFHLPDMVLDRRVQLGSCAHNAWLHRGELMTCSSADGILIGENGSKIITGGFPRGIAYSEGEINVGISEFASRPDRDLGKGWVKVFNFNWELLRTIEIIDQGMVTDIYSLSLNEANKIITNSLISKIDCIAIR